MGLLSKSKSPSKSPSKTPPSQLATNSEDHVSGVDHSNHDATAAKHKVPSAVTKFFVSSFDYIKAPHQPNHPAFTQWAKDAGSAYISVIWREFNGQTLPVAVTYEVKGGTRLDYLELSADGRKFTHEHIADIVVEVEKHVMHKNKDILMLVEASSNNRRAVRGDLFKVKGGMKICSFPMSSERSKTDVLLVGTTMFPSQDDPGVHLLTQGFTKDGHQSIWEVQNDKSLLAGIFYPALHCECHAV